MLRLNKLDCPLKLKYPIIGHGNQGTVFKINDDTVLKIYNVCGRRNSECDDLEVAKRLGKLILKRYVTPFDIKERNNLITSFKMKKITFDHVNVVDLKIKDYIDSLREVREDTEKISSAGVQLRDLQEHNICVSNGKITIYDFSDYFLGNKFVRIHNNNAINDCFGSLCLMRICGDNPILVYDSIYSPFLCSGFDNFEDYLDSKTDNKNMTVREYVYSLKK